MPEIINKNGFSIDNYFYNNIKECDNKICILEPNYVTIFNIFLTLVITYLYYKNTNIFILLLFVIFRTYLDILDGGLARKCNKYSDLGKQLDLFGDIFFYLLFAYVGYFKLSKKSVLLKYILVFLSLIAIILYFNCIMTDYDALNNVELFSFIHDNTMIFIPLVFLIFYYIIEKN
jgi:phosphatidylglycerophosphate synthase